MREPRWVNRHIRWHIWEAPWWISDSFIGRGLLRVLCLIFGHEPTADQCLKPEHDFCPKCSKSMPWAAHQQGGHAP